MTNILYFYFSTMCSFFDDIDKNISSSSLVAGYWIIFFVVKCEKKNWNVCLKNFYLHSCFTGASIFFYELFTSFSVDDESFLWYIFFGEKILLNRNHVIGVRLNGLNIINWLILEAFLLFFLGIWGWWMSKFWIAVGKA